MAHLTGGLTDAEVEGKASGVPPLPPRTGGRRGDDPFQATPGEPSGMQSPGILGNMLGLPLDPSQGVTGKHGETGDPLAREIESGVVMNGPMMLLGQGARALGRGILASKGGQAAETIATRGAEAIPGPAEEAVAAHGLAEARLASRRLLDELKRQELRGNVPVDQAVARSPEIRAILELPSKLEEQIARTHDVPNARETLQFKAPSLHSAHSTLGYAGAKFAADNAQALAGRLAPAARALVDSKPILTSPQALTLFQAAASGRGQ